MFCTELPPENVVTIQTQTTGTLQWSATLCTDKQMGDTYTDTDAGIQARMHEGTNMLTKGLMHVGTHMDTHTHLHNKHVTLLSCDDGRWVVRQAIAPLTHVVHGISRWNQNKNNGNNI